MGDLSFIFCYESRWLDSLIPWTPSKAFITSLFPMPADLSGRRN
jgi:hypothetical protein